MVEKKTVWWLILTYLENVDKLGVGDVSILVRVKVVKDDSKLLPGKEDTKLGHELLELQLLEDSVLVCVVALENSTHKPWSSKGNLNMRDRLNLAAKSKLFLLTKFGSIILLRFRVKRLDILRFETWKKDDQTTVLRLSKVNKTYQENILELFHVIDALGE